MAPYLWLIVLGGYGFAHWDRALLGQGGTALLLTLVSWTFLHAGTLWLNAALDQDEGEVLWGTAAAVPDGIEWWAYGALGVCMGTAALAGTFVFICAAGCSILAVLYSHPSAVWKGHSVGGPVVNGVGYGLLTPIAGFACVGVPPTPRAGITLIIGLCGVMAAYYAAQAFQGDEDRARNYRTLVARQGMAATVWATRLWMWAGFSGAVLCAAMGWVPRIVLLVLPLFVWVDAHARRWQNSGEANNSDWAKGFASRLLAGALTALALLFFVYMDDSWHNRPVAGLGTAAGHPGDRPLLPPRQMRQWERQKLGSQSPE
ncbi:MAG: hypothetical protein ACJAZO_000519 [Myxococcota bacterium]|jgi:hypothetical protein